MADIWRLAKAGFLPFFGIYRSNRHKRFRRRGAKFALVIGMAAMVLLLLGTALIYEYSMMFSLAMVGAQDLLLPIIMVAASIMTFFASVFRAGNALFSFREYDLLMCLPVPTWKVSASRMLLLYMFDFFFAAILLLPAGALHAAFASPSAAFYPLFLPTLFAVPMLPLALSAAVGTGLMALLRRFKRKNFLTMIVSIAGLALVMALSFRSQELLMDFSSIGQQIFDSVTRAYPPVQIYNRAVIGSSLLDFILFMAVSLGAMLLISLIAAKNIARLHEAFAVSGEMSRYKGRKGKVSSPFMALYRKEMRRFFSSNVLMMNAGIGVLLYTMAAVAMLIFGKNSVLETMGFAMFSDNPMLYGFMPAVICFFVIMTFPSAAMVSLEGKSISLLKSLPVNPVVILWSKACVSLTLTVPAVIINGAIVSAVFGAPIVYAAFIIIIPLLMAVATAAIGVLVNLKFPSLNWSSEVTVVKQSASTMVMTLLGFLLTAATLVASAVTDGSIAGLVLISLAISLLCIVCIVLMRTWGVKKFIEL
ncbi:MAG: hypothetical protein ACOX8S_11090 [Christensenellales bacterium]|jgi:ABC-2 type transport system permease protein